MEQKLISLSDLIKDSWNLYVHNMASFIFYIIISLIIPLAASLLEYFLIYNIWLFVLLMAIGLFIDLWISVSLIEIVNRLYNKTPIEAKAINFLAFQKVPRYLWISFVTGLLIGLGLVALIIPGIIFAVWFSLTPYIFILEGERNVVQALKASYNLVNGRFWKTLARLLFPPLLIYAIVLLIVGVITYIISGGNIDLINPDSTTNLTLNLVSGIILSILTPLFFTFTLILYNNLKASKLTQQ